MILKFRFELDFTNGVVEKILLRVAKETGVKLGLSRDERNLFAYVKASEEIIEDFSKKLANELPISIFLKSLDAEVTNEFKDDLKREFPSINLPPCPKCLREVKDKNNFNYYNPFYHCEVCGYKSNGEMKSYKEVFENLAFKLKNKEKIYIQTMNGKYEVSTSLEDAEIIVAVDLSAVATYFMSFVGEAKALGSIEKPFVNLKTNLNFKKEFGISNPSFLVKLPDCMVLELLCEEIKDDIKLLGLKKTQKSDDFSFDVENKDEVLLAVVTDTRNKDILIQRGDRALLPKYEKAFEKKVVGAYKEYSAYVTDDKTILKKEKNDSKIKPAFAGYFGVLAQWNLENKNSVGFAFYKEEDSKIMLNSPKFGLVEYIDFDFKFSSFEEIFASIKAMNETGEKLVKNFFEKQKDLALKALNADFSTSKKGVAYLWGVIGVLLGFGDNIDEGFERLLRYANSAMTKKGPRIDYKMKDKNLDPLWAVRTVMSFKLAGVDDYLLSFGVIESFAEFLTNIYEQLHKESLLDGAVIVGDLFEGEFLNKVYTNIKKNYPTFTPKALPISGAIEAYGSAFILSKTDN